MDGVRRTIASHPASPFQITVSPAVRALILSPPEGSAVKAAREFGFNVVGLAIKLATTNPDERIRILDDRIEECRKLRKALQP